jgi:hypothetical protein
MAVILIAAWTAFVFALSFWIVQAGLLVVNVQNKITGSHLYVPVPMILVNAATGFVPESATKQLRMALGSKRNELRAVLDTLSDCPDATFVEVHKNGNHVQITKKGDALYIHTDSPQKEARIRIPLRSASHLATD